MRTINVSETVSIQNAIEKAKDYKDEEVVIKIPAGIYYEKITLEQDHVYFIGESKDNTIIQYDDYALKMHEDGRKYGTFRSYTMIIDASDVILKNLTIKNMCESHNKAGQALALYADGDRIRVFDCNLMSFQDTLFTGPLPPFPYSIGGFTGPKEFSERINGRQYYKNCFISGDIDFIFGSATAYFEDCVIFATTDEKNKCSAIKGESTLSYLTAASTAEGQEYGYIFNNCRLESDLPDETVYLGRPWRDYAKTVFINCYMGSHIKKEGFHDWNKENARETIHYAEYNSFGPGANDNRASFVKSLTKTEADHYSFESVLGHKKDWSAIYSKLILDSV